MFEILVAAAAIVAAAIASVAGFGIGSILTPLLSTQMETRLAVAAVSIPHFLATALRFWMLRRDVDVRTLVNFGILSAVGGLTGAFLHSRLSSPTLTFIFACLLIFAGLTGVSGYSRRMRFGPRTAWIAGAVSGLFGGLVGNQGGIRSAALLGYHLERRAFVATATGIGLIVDLARMPFYVATEGRGLVNVWTWIAIASAGTLAGTILGARLLGRIPETLFQRLVAALVLALGVFMMVQASTAAGS